MAARVAGLEGPPQARARPDFTPGAMDKSWEGTIEWARSLGINLHGGNYREVYGLSNWSEGQILPETHHINLITRKVMLKIAPDKCSSRQWNEEQEKAATDSYRRLIAAREEVIEYIKRKDTKGSV